MRNTLPVIQHVLKKPVNNVAHVIPRSETRYGEYLARYSYLQMEDGVWLFSELKLCKSGREILTVRSRRSEIPFEFYTDDEGTVFFCYVEMDYVFKVLNPEDGECTFVTLTGGCVDNFTAGVPDHFVISVSNGLYAPIYDLLVDKKTFQEVRREVWEPNQLQAA